MHVENNSMLMAKSNVGPAKKKLSQSDSNEGEGKRVGGGSDASLPREG